MFLKKNNKNLAFPFYAPVSNFHLIQKGGGLIDKAHLFIRYVIHKIMISMTQRAGKGIFIFIRMHFQYSLRNHALGNHQICYSFSKVLSGEEMLCN